jgi:hypothetical protein
MEEAIEQLKAERDVYEARVAKLDKIISELENIDDGKVEPKKPGKKRGRRGHYKKHTKKSIEKVSEEKIDHRKYPNHVKKKPSHNPKSKYTEEIDEYLVKNSHKKNPELLKEISKKFGIKTTLGGLAFHISAEGLRKNKLREAAESELEDDDDDDSRVLPPEEEF